LKAPLLFLPNFARTVWLAEQWLVLAVAVSR